MIDANNPIEAPLFKPAELGGRISSEVFADLVPGARVVKAFNHLAPQLLASRSAGGRRTARAVLFRRRRGGKGQIAALIERLGFFGIDLGSLAVGGRSRSFRAGRCRTRISSGSAERLLMGIGVALLRGHVRFASRLANASRRK